MSDVGIAMYWWQSTEKITRAMNLVEQIARMTIEGEIIDGKEYMPTGNDEEVDALYGLILEARELTGAVPDGLEEESV